MCTWLSFLHHSCPDGRCWHVLMVRSNQWHTRLHPCAADAGAAICKWGVREQGCEGNAAIRTLWIGGTWCYLTYLDIIWYHFNLFECLIFLHPGISRSFSSNDWLSIRQEWRVKDVRLFERIASLQKWSHREKEFFGSGLGNFGASTAIFICHLYSGIPFMVTCDINDSI